MAATPLVAFAVDRRGARPVLILGGICLLAGSLVFVLAQELSARLYLGRILQGVGFAAYQTAVVTVLAAVLPTVQRAYGFGLFGVVGNVALAVGPPVAEWIVRETNSFRVVFAIGALLAVGPMLTGWKVTSRSSRAATASPWRFRHVWPLRAALLAAMLQGGSFGVVVSFMPLHARAAGITFSAFFAAYTTTLVLTRLAGGSLIERARRHGMVPLLLVVWAAALAFLAPGLAMWQLLLSGTSAGFGQAVLYPVLSANVLDVSSPEHRARALGLSGLSFSLGGSLFVMACGSVADHWGYGRMFGAMACTTALGAAWVARLTPRPGVREEANAPSSSQRVATATKRAGW